MRPPHSVAGAVLPDYRGRLGHNGPALDFSAFTCPDALSRQECAHIIDHIDHHDLARGRLAGGVKAPQIRSVASQWLDEHQISWLSERIVKCVAQASSRHFPFDLRSFDEGFQLLKYFGDGLTGPDFYDWHIDMGQSGASQSRKLTVLIQLSDAGDYEGGALEVNFAGDPATLSRARGALFVIPSFVLHRVGPVTSGQRYSLATWVHGPAFR